MNNQCILKQHKENNQEKEYDIIHEDINRLSSQGQLGLDRMVNYMRNIPHPYKKYNFESMNNRKYSHYLQDQEKKSQSRLYSLP